MAHGVFNTASGAIPFVGPPGIPSNLIAVAVGQNRIDLTWTLSTAKPTEKGVRVYRSTDGGPFVAMVDLPSRSITYSDTELLPGTTYSYYVVSLGRLIQSSPSNIVSTTTAGENAPVAHFTAETTTVTAGSSILFTNTSTGTYTASSWKVNGVEVSTLDSPSIPFDTPGTFGVTLTVTGPGGSDTTSPATNISVTAVSTPNLLSAVVSPNGTRWTLTFDATVTGHSGFVFRDGAGNTLSAVYVSGEGSTALLFDAALVYSGDTPHLDYTPGDVNHSSTPLAAFTGFVVTNDSDQQPVTPSDPPEAGTAAFDVTGRFLDITFPDAVSGYENVDPAFLNDFGEHGFSLSAPAGLLRIKGYVSGIGTDTIRFALGRTVTVGEVSGSAVARNYRPGLLTSGSGAPAAPYSGLSVTNNSAVADPAAPGTPTAVAVSSATHAGIFIGWMLADARDTKVQVRWSIAGADSWNTLPDLAGGTFCHNLQVALDQGVSYDVQVRAGNVSGWSSWSASGTGTTLATGTTAGLVVTGLTATALNNQSIQVSWTNPAGISSGSNVIVWKSTTGGADYGETEAATLVVNVGSAQSWVDAPLLKNTTYHYRVQVVTPGNTFSPFVHTSGTTSNTAGVPLPPKNFGHFALSETQSVFSWEDENGGLATVQFQTAPVPGPGTPDTAVWSAVAETAVGDISYSLTTVAKQTRYVRARSNLSGVFSEWTAFATGSTQFDPDRDVVRPPSGASGTMHIGTGQTYTTIAAAAAAGVLNKKTVYLHGTFHERFLFGARGRANDPVRYIGVDDGSGYPVFDGIGTTTPTQFTTDGAGRYDFSDSYLTFVGKVSGVDPNGYQPGHIRIENITFRNASIDVTGAGAYTAADGTSRTFSRAVAGIYMAGGDHIVCQDFTATGNGNGIFGANNGTDLRDLARVVIRGMTNSGNGTVNVDRQHGSYMESRGIVYEACEYGSGRVGALGGALKDRSTGLVVRACKLAGTQSILVHLVEPDNSKLRARTRPEFARADVSGNLIVIPSGYQVAGPIWYGVDSGTAPGSRRGMLRWRNNTLADYNPGGAYRFIFWKPGTAASAVCAINSVQHTANLTETDLLIAADNNAAFGVNFVGPGWRQTVSGSLTTGQTYGTGNFVSPTDRKPAFIDPSNGDYRVLENTPCAGAGSRVPNDWPDLDVEFVSVGVTQARANASTGCDLGYTTAAPDTTAPTVSGTVTVNELGNQVTVPLSEACVGGTGFVLTVNGSPVSLTKNTGASTSTSFVYNTASVVLTGQTCLLSKSGGDIADVAGNAMADFSGRSVTNTSLIASASVPIIAGSNYATGASSTTFTLTAPSGTTAGDLLFAEENNASAGGTGTTTEPAGHWTKITETVDTPTGAVRLITWWRVADGTGSDNLTLQSTAAKTWAGGILRITGADTGSPIADAQTAISTSNATTITAPDATAVDNSLVLRMVAAVSVIGSVPSGTIELWRQGGSGASAANAAAAKGQASAGATGPAVFTFSTVGRGAAVTVVIRPAP